MSKLVDQGQRLTVGFLALCSALGIINVVYGLAHRTEESIIFGLAQGVFSFFTGAAAWNILHWKKIGWYLGFFVVLQWFSSLVRGNASWYTLVLTLPIIAMAIWLSRAEVRGRFEVKKVFG